MTEISKVLGKKWSGLGAEEKEKYTKMANDDRERYAKEMEDYKQTSHEEDKPIVKKQK